MKFPQLPFVCLLFAAALPAIADDLTPRPVMGEIIRLDPAFDALVPAARKSPSPVATSGYFSA